MEKKSGDRVRCRNKSAQVTVFMIIGLLILFAFIFLIALTSQIQKGKLQTEQEKVFTKAFKKEAMRIYVEDCLNDGLEEALILIGKQGRIWSDQPGGTKGFTEGITGTTHPPDSKERVFYSISNNEEDYPQHKNAYPCKNEENNPEFCQYEFPNTKLGFGKLDLKTSTLESDLRRYLINRTLWCIVNYTKTNISAKANVKVSDLKLGLDIENDGINVKADFPLKFSLGTEEFFHLSTFDFFYPTQFKWLLEAAVIRPLFYDWKYLDFDYTEAVLKQHFVDYVCETGTCQASLFSDKYNELSIEMDKEELPNGDDIFIFKAPEIISKPGFYEFRIARQNRPPALDYVNRSECPLAGYDYLVIKNDSELGEINITLFALDPDEDNVGYGFGQQKSLGLLNQNTQDDNEFFMDFATVSQLPNGVYKLVAEASDGNLEDWQEVRILVDRPITLEVSLRLPYDDVVYSSDSKYVVSNEDPAFIDVTFPKDSETDIEKTISFEYSNKEKSEKFGFDIPGGLSVTETCYSLPWADEHPNCDLEDYNDGKKLEDWDKLLKTKDFSHFKELTQTGSLDLSFSSQYCDAFDKDKSAKADIIVKSCTPHKTPAHPYAYPYHGYTFTDYDFFDFESFNNMQYYTNKINNSFNPFLATHSCCSGEFNLPNKWKLKEKGEVCFINPKIDCYGRVEGLTIDYNPNKFNPDSFGGYVLEKQVGTCDGKRGNACLGSKKYELYNDDLFCGSDNYDYCYDIPDICQNLPAWNYYDSEGDGNNDGWCHGTLGCEKKCDSEVVVNFGQIDDYFTYRIKQIKNNVTTDQEFGLHCGCDQSDSNLARPCDADFSGDFEGKCRTTKNGFECVST